MTQLRLILVEDDPRLSKLISTFLSSEGFLVELIERGDTAIERIIVSQPDLVVLDMMLPGVDGLEVCQQVRCQYNKPIIMITANDDELTEISALNFGVDDFIAKPLRPHVLLARINANLRRVSAPVSESVSDNMCVQDIEMDIGNRTVVCQNQMVELSDAEFDLLKALLENAGQLISRDSLFQSVRGVDYDGADRSIDMRISTLRKKLNDTRPPHRYIKSVRGKGYLFMTDDGYQRQS